MRSILLTPFLLLVIKCYELDSSQKDSFKQQISLEEARLGLVNFEKKIQPLVEEFEDLERDLSRKERQLEKEKSTSNLAVKDEIRLLKDKLVKNLKSIKLFEEQNMKHIRNSFAKIEQRKCRLERLATLEKETKSCIIS